MNSSPKRTVDLRRLNRQTLLKQVYFAGPISRIELSQRTDLSTATITNLATELLDEEIVQESGSQESEGGRPATLLKLNPHYGYMVGVDLGETHIQLELFDLALKNIHTTRYLLSPEQNTPENFVAFIASGIEQLIAQSGILPEKLLGVGIGVPGVVERNASVCVLAPLWNWEPVPLLDMLEARIPYPIFLDNGAKAMTLAESWFGAGKNKQDLAVILIGTGIGAGIITEGKLYRGIANAAGEWGHTKITLDGRPCRCGSHGCVEAYAGAEGVIQTVHELSTDSPLLNFDNQLAFMNALVAAADQNDPVALETIRITAQYLGLGLANLINLFNPEMILLGGWVGTQMGKPMLASLIQYIEEYALPPAFRAVTIDVCKLAEDAVCIGAACLVLDEVLFINYELKTI